MPLNFKMKYIFIDFTINDEETYSSTLLHFDNIVKYYLFKTSNNHTNKLLYKNTTNISAKI